MRISDWSSDVCSSDLVAAGVLDVRHDALGDDGRLRRRDEALDELLALGVGDAHREQVLVEHLPLVDRGPPHGQRPLGVPDAVGHVLRVADGDLDRKRVGSGKSGSVRVDLGGRRFSKKKYTAYK